MLTTKPSMDGTPIPGILILKDNKTYGRHKTNGKLMYKCVPDDKTLPIFLVHYEFKNVGFSKRFNNLYVIFTYSNWDNKHPYGIIQHTIGDVDNLSNFYEYQLHCKQLNFSLKNFTKDTKHANNETIIHYIIHKYPTIENRTKEWNIFTIDPENCTDFDDAFSIKQITNEITQLSVYISNVSILIDTLDLWNSFSRRISTIYLPDKKIPMLPSILSDGLCSLKENETRVSLVMDIFIENNAVINIAYSNCLIKVSKNYIYEEPALLNNPHYKHLLQFTHILSNNHKYIHKLTDSHEIVSYLMILMNYNCALEMTKHNNGIFRITTTTITETNLPENIRNIVYPYSNVSGKYSCDNMKHQTLDLDAYIHITSPIRRIVDLLNSIQFQRNNNIVLSDNAYIFLNKWINELEYINTTMRSIRKVQNECSLLNLYMNTPEITNKIYEGYVYERKHKNETLFKFMVYLPELKLYSSFSLSEDLEIYTKHTFKLFLFNDAETFKQKIRLQRNTSESHITI